MMMDDGFSYVFFGTRRFQKRCLLFDKHERNNEFERVYLLFMWYQGKTYNIPCKICTYKLQDMFFQKTLDNFFRYRDGDFEIKANDQVSNRAYLVLDKSFADRTNFIALQHHENRSCLKWP